VATAALAFAALAPSGAHAQDGDGSARAFGVRGIGPRIGLSIDPDQLHLGGHLDLGDLGRRVNLMSSLEVGFGDDLVVLTLMADVVYRFPEIGSGWMPYAGGGLGPVFVSVDGGGDDTELGLTGQGGLARRTSGGSLFFIEMKLGLIETPDVKFTVGWTFAR